MTLPTTTNVDRPRSQGYDVDIDGNLFRLLPSPDNPSSVVTKEREAIDPDSPGGRAGAGESPEFTQFHFENGEGLQWGHSFDADPFDIHRFWRSENLSPDLSFEEGRGSVHMSPTTEIILSKGTNYNGEAFLDNMAYADGKLFVIDSEAPGNVLNTADPLAASPTFNSEDATIGGTSTVVNSLASVGQVVYGRAVTDIWERNPDGTWDLFYSDGNIIGLWSVKGRLLYELTHTTAFAADKTKLFELSTDQSVNKELFEMDKLSGGLITDRNIADITDAGHGVLCASREGYVYTLGEEEGELTLKARTPFEGEEVVSIEHSKGVVLVATRWSPASTTVTMGRLYTAQLGGDYTLQNVNLIREWEVGDTEDNAACFITSAGNDFYFSVSDNGAAPHIWRYNLGTGGLFKEVSTPLAKGTWGLLVIRDRLFQVVSDGSIVRVDEPSNPTSNAHFISPFITFNSHEPKVWSYISIEADVGGVMDVWYRYKPEDSWTQIVNNWSFSGREVKTLFAKDWPDFPEPSKWLQLKVEVTSFGTPTSIYNYTVAAAPTHTFQLPVLISDEVRRPGRKPVTVPGLGEEIYEKLHDLDDTSSDGPKTLKFHKTGDEYIGLVSTVAFQEVSSPEYGGATTIALVEFQGRKVAGT